MTSTLKKILDNNPRIKQATIFVYSRTLGAYLKQKENKNFLKNGKTTLEQANMVFEELGVEYWLEFGTLLGAVRNKDFIKHDTDLDLGMFLSDFSNNNEHIFNKYGFKKVRSFTIDDGRYGREETYQYLNVNLDIFYFTQKPSKNKATCHLFKPIEGKSRDHTIKILGGLIPKEFELELASIGEIDFKNKYYPVPASVEKHLIDIYGPDYMIENPAWETGKGESPNVTVLKNKVGIRTIY